jgi:sensor histidine kinase YesM
MSETVENEDEDVDRDKREHRYDQLIEHRDEQQSTKEKWLLQLSIGAIAVSLTTVNQIGVNGNFEKGLLFSSWLFWLLTVLIILYSFHLSVKAHNIRIQGMKDGEDDRKDTCTEYWIRVANTYMLYVFFLGCVTFFFFISLRLWYNNFPKPS